jgi:hypothetical protein
MFADASYYGQLLKDISNGVPVPPDKLKEVGAWALGKLQELRVINQQVAAAKKQQTDQNA